MAKSKPPYADDPNYTYIVIDDPWPGNANGPARNVPYWNKVSAWVWFMLGKPKEGPESIFSVNTRVDIIVKLPKEVDVVPILGAHRWIKFLSHGDEKDKKRVSYIFQYNYHMRGDPGEHNWLEHYPAGGEPPPQIRFPVRFPYPPPSWASPANRNSGNMSLSLPPTRTRTPTPPPNLFTPYERPAHLAGQAEAADSPAAQATSSNASAEPARRSEPAVKTEEERSLQGHVAKPDPYEEVHMAEDAALQIVKQEPVDGNVRVKQEHSDVPVKREDIPKPVLSELYLAEFERHLQRARGAEGTDQSTVVQPGPINGHVTPMSGPSSDSHRPQPSYRVKPEPQDTMLPPDIPLRPNPTPSISLPQRQPELLVRVKFEPQDGMLPPLSAGGVRGPSDGRPRDPRTRDPRLQRLTPSKRVKEEEDEGNAKRIKAEQNS